MDSVVRSILRACFESSHHDLILLVLALSASDIRFSRVSLEDLTSLTILLRSFSEFRPSCFSVSLFSFPV